MRLKWHSRLGIERLILMNEAVLIQDDDLDHDYLWVIDGVMIVL